MTQAAAVLMECAPASPILSSMSSSSSFSACSSSVSSSTPSSSAACAERFELAAAASPSLASPSSASSPLSPSAALFLPPAKSTRSSLLAHKRTSSTASTASNDSNASASSTASSACGSSGASYPPSPVPATPPSLVALLPSSPSRLRIQSGLAGLADHFNGLLPVAFSPSSAAAAAQKPPLSPSSGTRMRRSRVHRTLSQQPPPPSPGPSLVASSPANKRKRSLAPHTLGNTASSSLTSAGQLPSQPMLHSATSLLPLATRSLSIPAHFRASSASSTLPQSPFRSIAHDVLSTGSPVSSPHLSAGPSRSPSPSMSPCQSSRRSSFSFHPLPPASSLAHYSSSSSFFPPSISASPILLPQPNFDLPPPSPPPLEPSPTNLHPNSSPSPTPSPPPSPSLRWQGRGKLPLCGKTADGVAMVSCATVAELLRGRDESALKKRRHERTEDDKQGGADVSLSSETDTSTCSASSSPMSWSSSACSTPSPVPGSLPPFDSMFDDVIVLDCRFPYEFNGGHIPSAVNITSFAQLQDILFAAVSPPGELAIDSVDAHASGDGGADASGAGGAAARVSGRTCLVFHCEFSQSRAPQYFSSLRRLNESSLSSYAADSSSTPVPICPVKLLSSCPYPDMYVMEGGYRRWVEEHADLCEPVGGYVEMRDRRWRDECGKGLKERKQEKRGEIERKRRRQQHGTSALAHADDDGLRRITRSSTAAAALTAGGAELGGLGSPVFRRTSSCSSLLCSSFSPIPLSLLQEEDVVGGSSEKEERRSKREKR